MSDVTISMSLSQAVELFALLINVRKKGGMSNLITDDKLFQVTESLRDAMVYGN